MSSGKKIVDVFLRYVAEGADAFDGEAFFQKEAGTSKERAEAFFDFVAEQVSKMEAGSDGEWDISTLALEFKEAFLEDFGTQFGARLERIALEYWQ